MHPKVLIVGTSPYDTQGPARAFETYFANWERDNLIQIFSSPVSPIAGHCKELYQITDSQMLYRWCNPKSEVGKLYLYDELPKERRKTSSENPPKSLVSKLYRIGSKKNALIYLLRNLLWRKKYWCTERINKWVDSFKPECVFLAFSDDFFILKIALYFANRYDIPIVSCIGDDYYFNDKKHGLFLYRLYRKKYKRLVNEVFAHGGSAAYIGDKIRNKYNNYFKISGETVYLTSKIVAHDFKAIDCEKPKFLYCGNIRLGRNHSLNDIGNALQEINKDYKLYVFSNEEDKTFYKELVENPGIVYGGAIPYSQVVLEMGNADVLVIVEGFAPKDVNITKYSLSTKVADSLATGGAVFAYGSDECGAIEYAEAVNCITVCTNKAALLSKIKGILADVDMQKSNYDKARKIVRSNHTLMNSNAVFEKIVLNAIDNYRTI